MNPYLRETRKILQSLGVLRRPASSRVAIFLAGAGLGAVAGAALGAFLLTPTNRKQLQELVSSKADQIASTGKAKIAETTTPSANGAGEEVGHL